MKTDRTYPIQYYDREWWRIRDEYDLPRAIPWDFLVLARAQGEINHGQTLERLRERR